ncbi:MAG: ArdC family protein [Actinomycetota bacterium]
MASLRVVSAAEGPLSVDLPGWRVVPVLPWVRTGAVAMSSRAEELHQDLLEQVAQLRTSEEWLEAMVTAARFHDYSFGNWLLLWSQAEHRGTTVTRPAGYRRWQSLGRQVRKGEKGYRILAPVTRRVKVDRADDEDTELRVVGFRVVTVFDIAQTDGEPLPDVGPRLLTGEGDADLLEAGISMIEDAGYSYAVEPLRGPNGVTRPGGRQVLVDSGLEGAQLTKTTIHELAHVLMHADDGRVDCRGRVEVEAESVAYVVCAASGLDTSAYSVAYVAGWAEHSDDPERTLLATGERVVTHARRVLAGFNRFYSFPREISDLSSTASNLSAVSDMISHKR